jgi:hypothetical protein
VAVDGSGNVYVADSNNNAVKEMPAGCTSSSCVTTLGGGFSYPTGVAVDGSGNVYVADYGNNAVKEMPAGCTSSSCVTTLGGGFSDPMAWRWTAAATSTSRYPQQCGEGDARRLHVVQLRDARWAAASALSHWRGGGRQRQRLRRRFNNNAVKEMPAACTSSSCVSTLGWRLQQPHWRGGGRQRQRLCRR